MAWTRLTNIELTNGSKEVKVYDNVNLSQLKPNWMLDHGGQLYEIESGADFISGYATITLKVPFSGAGVSGQSANIIPTNYPVVEMFDEFEQAIVELGNIGERVPTMGAGTENWPLLVREDGQAMQPVSPSTFFSKVGIQSQIDAAVVDATAESESWSNLSRDWAEKGEDVEVSPGNFSSKHWAAKAEKAATTTLKWRGSWNANSAPPEPSPQVGDYYRVSVAGNYDGKDWQVGDSAIYNGTEYEQFDGSDAVSSVAGKIGAVTLTASDITNIQEYIEDTIGASVVGTEIVVSYSASTGKLTLSLPSSISSNTTGNAATATKLAAQATISLTGDASGSTSFDGSGAVSLPVTVADDSHLHDVRYYTKSQIDADFNPRVGAASFNVGRGNVWIENNSNDNADGAGITVRTSINPSTGSMFAVRSSGQASRLWVGQTFTTTGQNSFAVGTDLDGISNPKAQIFANGVAEFSGNVSAPTFVGDLSGKSGSSEKLAYSRKIQLTGDVTGSVTFDGTGDVAINATVVESQHAHDAIYYTKTQADGKYLAKAGGNVTGDIRITKNGGVSNGKTVGSATIGFNDSSNNQSVEIAHDPFDSSLPAPGFALRVRTAADSSQIGQYKAQLIVEGSIFTNDTERVFSDGYRPLADKWTNARRINITGDATGTVLMDGSGDVSLPIEIINDSHIHDARYYTKGQSDVNYLATGGKAADASKLDGIDSSQFVRADIASSKTGGYMRMNDGITLRYGTTNDWQQWYSPSANTLHLMGYTNDSKLLVRSQNSAGQTATLIEANPNSSVDLFFNSAKVAETAADGITAARFHGRADQSDEWFAPRQLTISGDASGSTFIDGSKDETINLAVNDSAKLAGKAVTEFGRRVFETTNTQGTDGNKYTKVGRITITARYGDYNGLLYVVAGNSGSNYYHGGEIQIHVKQQADFGSNPYVDVNHYRHAEDLSRVGYVIVDNAGPTIVDIYLKVTGGYTVVSGFEIARRDTLSNVEFYSNQVFGVAPVELVSSVPQTIFSTANNGAGAGIDAEKLSGYGEDQFFRHSRGSVSASFNNYVETGSHCVAGFENGSVLDGPAGAYQWGMLRVTRFDGVNPYVCQEYIPHQLEGVWTRVNWNGTWTNWRKTISSDSDGSGSGLNADLIDDLHASQLLRSDAADVATGKITFNGGLKMGNGAIIEHSSTSSRDKIRVWDSGLYTIGMESAVSFGHLNEYAMTFQMNSTANRGFWWGHDGHSKAQGAMSLRNDGKLHVGSDITVRTTANKVYADDYHPQADNATTLAGLSVGSFLRADTNDTFTGAITGNALFLGGSQIMSSAASLQVNGFMRTGNINLHQGGNTPNTEHGVLSNEGQLLKWNGSQVLTVANEGSGNGIDADTVDGLQGSQLVTKVINQPNISTRIDSGFYEASAPTTANGWPAGAANWYHLMASTHSSGDNYFSMQFAGSFFDKNLLFYRVTDNNGNSTWDKVWTSGNDGANSGLDADTVDGLQGSQLVRSDLSMSVAGILNFTNSNPGVKSPRGMTGGYISGTHNNSWGANIWSIGDNWAGNGSHQDFAISNQFGLAWLRGSHADVNPLAGEGLHIYQAAEEIASIGSLAAVFRGAAYVSGNQRVFANNYHPNADKWTTARTITLGGDATGSVSIDGSANKTLTVTVANDSHTHDGRYYTETESDGRFTRVAATNLGSTAGAYNNTTNTAAEWSALPIGYSGFMHSSIGISGGLPDADFQYFTKIANRDVSGGWAGISIKHVDPKLYIGQALTSGDMPTWTRVLTTQDEGSGNGLDADSVDGLHSADLAVANAGVGHKYASPDNGTAYWAKVASWTHSGTYSHFYGTFRLSNRFAQTKIYIETQVGGAATSATTPKIRQDSQNGDLYSTGRIKLLFDNSGSTSKYELWAYVSGWSGNNLVELTDFHCHSAVSMPVFSADDAATSAGAPSGAVATYQNDQFILTTENMGPGNGIDADTVDGVHASSLLRRDLANQTTRWDRTFTGPSGSSEARNGGDAAGLTSLNNLSLGTWFGFSIHPTIAGQPIPQDTPAFSVNARTGDVYAANRFISPSAVFNVSAGPQITLANGSNNDLKIRFVGAAGDQQSGALIYEAGDANLLEGGYGFIMRSDGSPAQSGEKVHLEVEGNIYSNNSRVLTVANEGSGNGIDADTVDGLQGSQLVRDDIINTSSRFDHLAMTDVGAALLFDGDPGATFNSNSGGAVKRITCNDGGGNFNIWAGGYFNGGDKIVKSGDGAFKMVMTSDAAAASMVMKASNNVASANDEAISWGSEFKLTKDALTWGGLALITESTNKRLTIDNNSLGTIGTTSWANGWLRIGNSGAGIAIDPNEIFAASDLVITATTDLSLRGASLTFNGSAVHHSNAVPVIGNGLYLQHNTTQSRDKLRLWSSGDYAIGMDSSYTFGGIGNEYVMTFQMSDTEDRGFWWGDTAHGKSQGAMALTTRGKLTVAHSARIGYGEGDTTKPGINNRLDVNGSVGVSADINLTGDLNIGGSLNLSQPIPFPGVRLGSLPKFSGYANRWFAMCTELGQVVTVGDNGYGALGTGASVTNTQAALPQRVVLPISEKFIEVSQAHASGIALSESGRVFTWGRGNRGAVGSGGTADSYVIEPAGLPAGPKALARMTFSYYHESAAFVAKGSDLYVTGYNGSGQLGLNDTTQRNSFTKVTTEPWAAEQIIDLVGDGRSVFVLTNMGRVYGAGRNVDGVLGRGHTSQGNTFAEVKKDATWEITSVSKMALAGSNGGQTLYMLSGDSLYACGYGGSYSMGLGDASSRSYATLISGSVADFAVVGGNHKTVIMLMSDGRIKGFGQNEYGALGLGHSNQVTTPVYLTNGGSQITGAKRVFTPGPCSHMDQTFYVDSNDQLWGSGRNSYGCLGVGHSSSVNTYTQVPQFEPIVDMAGVCYIEGSTLTQTNYFAGESGRVYAAGVSDLGECGNGTQAGHNHGMVPFIIPFI